MRYRRATPLGPVRVEARIDHGDGRKIHVVASIADAAADGPTVEAGGVVIVPRWAMPDATERTRPGAQPTPNHSLPHA